jgi:hypothetical protein
MVQWATRDAGRPEVRWGEQPGNHTHRAAGHSVTYTREEMCGGAASGTGWFDPGMLHGATMGALQPSTKYYYKYGDEVGEYVCKCVCLGGAGGAGERVQRGDNLFGGREGLPNKRGKKLCTQPRCIVPLPPSMPV